MRGMKLRRGMKRDREEDTEATEERREISGRDGDRETAEREAERRRKIVRKNAVFKGRIMRWSRR